MDPAQNEVIALDPLDLDETVEVILLGDAVVDKVAVVADGLNAEGQGEVAGQGKGPRGKEIAAQFVGKNFIGRKRPVHLELPGVKGLTIAQTQRPPLL